MLTGTLQSEEKSSLADKFEKLLDSFAKKVYAHYAQYGTKGLDAFIDSDGFSQLASLTKKELLKAIEEGFAGKLLTEPDEVMLASLRQNVQVFSGFKTYQELRQATDLLMDSAGKIKPFGTYLQDIKTLNQTYNKAYLQVEYDQAIAQAQMARIWSESVAVQDLYDLQYNAVDDERVRASHKALKGIIRPVQDEFWQTFYPPNGWSCRCTVRKVPKTDTPLAPLPEDIAVLKTAVPTIFRTNTAAQGIVFPEKHPYYEEGEAKKSETRQRISALTSPIPAYGNIKPFDFAPLYAQEISQIKLTKDTHDWLKQRFGENYSLTDVLNLAGGFPEKDLNIKSIAIEKIKESRVEVRIITQEFKSVRYIEYQNNVLYMTNQISSSFETGTGLGTMLFSNQVLAMQKLSIQTIEANALKGKLDNGYYSHAVWGFQLSDSDLARLNNILKLYKKEPVKSLSELIQHDKKFWEVNGFGFEGTFDTTANNLSMQQLVWYYQQKPDKSNSLSYQLINEDDERWIAWKAWDKWTDELIEKGEPYNEGFTQTEMYEERVENRKKAYPDKTKEEIDAILEAEGHYTPTSKDYDIIGRYIGKE